MVHDLLEVILSVEVFGNAKEELEVVHVVRRRHRHQEVAFGLAKVVQQGVRGREPLQEQLENETLRTPKKKLEI